MWVGAKMPLSWQLFALIRVNISFMLLSREICFLLFFMPLFFLEMQAYAHSPYAIPEGIIETNHGKIQVERYFGDGIILAPDPVRGQLRDERGIVIAESPVNFNGVVFCPSLQHCWTFLFNPFATLPTAWKLAPEKIDWHASAPPSQDHHPEFFWDEAKAFEPDPRISLEILGTGLLIWEYRLFLAIFIGVRLLFIYAIPYSHFHYFRLNGEKFHYTWGKRIVAWLCEILYFFPVLSLLGLSFFSPLLSLASFAAASCVFLFLERFLPSSLHWMRRGQYMERRKH